MAEIRFQSRHGVERVVIVQYVDTIDNDLRVWNNGEVKTIAEDRKVRFRVMADSEAQVRTVRAVDAVYDGGPEFVDVKTGVNPDYACADTGVETLANYFFDGDKQIAYRTDDGKRLSVQAFLVRHPEYLDMHVKNGLPSDIADAVRGAIRDKSDPQKDVDDAKAGADELVAASPVHVGVDIHPVAGNSATATHAEAGHDSSEPPAAQGKE